MNKIILVGQWTFSHMEDIFSKNLVQSGFNVIPFATELDRHSNLYQLIPSSWTTRTLNQRLLELTKQEVPQFIFFWNTTHVSEKTYSLIKNMGVKIITYSNDDPYSKENKIYKSMFLWRLFLKSLKFSDFHFVYRPLNIIESQKYTTAPVNLLLPYFIPNLIDSICIQENDTTLFSNDIIFIGHYEDDKRAEYLEAIYDQGYQIKLYGTGWGHAPQSLQRKTGEVQPLFEEKYYKALKLAKICLAFFSKGNRDTFTRRCFEIPAADSLLLCERTEFMQSIFVEDQEAVFFSSKKEMLDKINWLLSNPSIRDTIAIAGKARAVSDGHDVLSRVQYFKQIITNN